MQNETQDGTTLASQRKPLWRRLLKWSALGCGGCTLLLILSTVAIFWLVGSAVPESYLVIDNPIPPPATIEATAGLDGFSSPYVGHTGSWDGQGGAMFGASKLPELDMEVTMGLQWTFMCVHWRQMEPEGPVDLRVQTPPAWESLDAFVIAAHERGLNILMQAPVIGGNAGGPPEWAGRREPGKSAPQNMDALVDFAGKLVERYAPGGTLATQQGWRNTYGVRVWELDNEPESYRTHWNEQEAEYAEFVTKVAARIKQHDPQALIATPAVASGHHSVEWLQRTLDNGQYSIGPATDIVSFHNYEGLDTLFAGEDFSVTNAFQQVRDVFEKYENRSSGHEYSPKQDYWHTEGNFDFIGAMSEERRAAWRFQFMTRAFAAGIRKVVVMDASLPEQVAVRSYVDALPNPFPMVAATDEINVIEGEVFAFRHLDSAEPEAGSVWVVWAAADTNGAIIDVPVQRDDVVLVTVDGGSQNRTPDGGVVRISLKSDAKMSPPVLIVDRPNE